MLPSFATIPDPLASLKFILPAKKSASETLMAAATKAAPTLTTAPCWMKTPFGFTTHTPPLALICPAICVPSMSAVTRFNVTAFAFGCLNVADSAEVISNVVQLMIPA